MIGAAVTAAWLTDAVLKRRIAVHEATLVTGLSLAMMMPRGSPWWLGAAGGVLAIGLAKHAFGGHRRNIFNPSAFARVALMVVLPSYFLAPEWALDGVSGATPLAKESGAIQWTLTDLARGDVFGALAQIMPAAVGLGGLLLMVMKISDWRVPLVYLGTIGLCVLLLPSGSRQLGHTPWLSQDLGTHLLGGGTLFAASFLLTDPVTSPVTHSGRIWFAITAGIITMLVRFYTPYPDGAAISVLVANLTVPGFDRLARIFANSAQQSQRAVLAHKPPVS